MNLILFGPPAAGRAPRPSAWSTAATWSSSRPATCCARRIASGSELGKRVGGIMQRGDLVSDEIVIELIESRLPEAEAAGGAIFDGFPRTIAQAEALDAMLAGRGAKIDLVVA
jgi:adenylate kinase